MITLQLPLDIVCLLENALNRAGDREIGGILMAEHVGTNEFVVRDITIHGRGTIASFVRLIEEAAGRLKRFFRNTNKNYTRFNYIGEWHSHPSFEPFPSGRDHRSMRDIISDASVGANFVVLLIVKLDKSGSLMGTAHTYLPNDLVGRSILTVNKSCA